MRHQWVRAVGLAAGLGAAVLLALAFTAALESRSYNVWGAMLVVPLIVVVNVLILMRVTAREDDSWVARLMWLAYAAKLAATGARYVMAYVLYGGASDAERYNAYAAWEYLRWRRGPWHPGFAKSYPPPKSMTSQDLAELDRAFGPPPIHHVELEKYHARWRANGCKWPLSPASNPEKLNRSAAHESQ